MALLGKPSPWVDVVGGTCLVTYNLELEEFVAEDDGKRSLHIILPRKLVALGCELFGVVHTGSIGEPTYGVLL